MHLKLGRLEIGAREYAPPRITDGPMGGVVGSDGQAGFYSGFWRDDPNPLWRTRQRYAVIEEMRKSDPSVRSALLLYKLPIRAAKWRVEPVSSTNPVDLLVADACAWQLGIGTDDGPLSGSWSLVLDQALKVLDYGAMFEEKIWHDAAVDWRDADGTVHPMFAVQHLGPRAPATVEEIQTDERTGKIASFIQGLADTRPIPPEKIIPHAVDRENGDWWGTSMLRPMWGSWKLKKQLMISSGIGWDRFAAGIPVVRHPAGSGNAQRAQQIGRSLRQHERGYVAFEEGTEWSLEILAGSGSLADPVPLLNFYCQQIADSALEFFSTLGTTQHGSRAVGEVLIDPFFDAVGSLAVQLATTYRKHLLREFVTHNFGADVEVPEIIASGIGTRDVSILCQALYDASNAGLDFKDVETQNAIRELLDLPDLPDDYAPPKPGEGLAPLLVGGVNPLTGAPNLPPAAPPPTPPVPPTPPAPSNPRA